MVKTIAVIGSRAFKGSIDYYLDLELPGYERLVSGGARGVDAWAEHYAAEKGISVVSYRPMRKDDGWIVVKYVDGFSTGPVRHDGEPIMFPAFVDAAKARNWWIVRDAEKVVALWDGASSGTAQGIAAAVRLGRPVSIWMDGDS